MALTNILLADTAAPVYTSTGMNVIVSGFFCNLHNSPVEVTVYAVPDGAVAQENYTIYKGITIAPGDTYIVDTEKIILSNGESLAAEASVADVIAVTLVTMAI